MLALVLALFAVGPVPQNLAREIKPQVDADRKSDNTVSPVTVNGKTDKGAPVAVTIDMPSDDTAFGEFVSIWPVKAYRNGTEGRVTLRCRISIHGLAEVCGVLSESPQGAGFGAAAMQLRPTFKVTPIKGPGGAPIEAQVDIAVNFHPPRRDLNVEGFQREDDRNRAGLQMDHNPWSKGDPHNNVILSDRTFIGNPMATHTVTMLSKPVWAAAPGFDDVAGVYPAKAAGAEGYVVAHCQVAPGGDLKSCGIVKETPSGVGFAKAGLALTGRFKVIPELSTTPDHAQLWVDIPIRLPPPEAQPDRTVSQPTWLNGVETAAAAAFPAPAAAKGLKSGIGVADCIVGPGGAMTQCAPGPGAPEGLGFSEAVASLASTLKVALWSSDAGPVYGGQVRLEMRINLKK